MAFRDLMAPDTEPTDEELGVVMREARDLAIQRRAIAQANLAERLEEAVREVRERWPVDKGTGSGSAYSRSAVRPNVGLRKGCC